MSELYYAVLKNNRVMNVIVVEQQDDNAIKSFCDAMEYDEFIYLAESPTITIHSLRVNGEFIPADFDYLKEIGLSTKNNAEQAAELAAREQAAVEQEATKAALLAKLNITQEEANLLIGGSN